MVVFLRLIEKYNEFLPIYMQKNKTEKTWVKSHVSNLIFILML
nr:MAG TPA: hypothetical protein [Caudoviricetes sp.]